MKYFKNKEEMTVRDITEVLYNSSKFKTYFPPLFEVIIGWKYDTYILDILVLNGLINPAEYSIFEKYGKNDENDFIFGIANGLNKKLKESSREPIDKALLTSYLSALILKSHEEAFRLWFHAEASVIGAVDDKTSSSVAYDICRRRYREFFRNISNQEWKTLINL